MITPVSGSWNVRMSGSTPAQTPYVTTSGFAFDEAGNFPRLFRGPNVRSAKNCWSLPSGLHECGLTLEEQFKVELQEELNLTAIGSAETIGVYENIAAVDNWHWVIVVMAIRVKTLDTIKNSEPDKHPAIDIKNIFSFTDVASSGPWAPGLGEFLAPKMVQIRAAADRLLRPTRFE